MTTSRLIRAPLWATLLIALVAAMVSLFAFVPSSEGAPAGDKPTYEPQIINGQSVPDGKYPFMAALLDQSRPGTEVQDDLNCGASLIDKKHVLTAGHCVLTAQPTGPPELVKRQDLQVIVGRTVLTSDQGHVRNVKDIDVHPAFKGGATPESGFVNQSYDVAVLTLSRPVKGIKPIQPASSKQDNLEKPGRKATVAGWGSTTPQPACGDGVQPAPLPDRMREAQVPIVSDSKAEQLYDGDGCAFGDVNAYTPRLMLAAGGNGKDTCQGDSGGPLFVRTSGHDDNGRNGDDKNGGKYTQIGITSFGPGCGDEPYPGAYTEVNAKPIASFIERAADNGDGDGDNGDDDKQLSN